MGALLTSLLAEKGEKEESILAFYVLQYHFESACELSGEKNSSLHLLKLGQQIYSSRREKLNVFSLVEL